MTLSRTAQIVEQYLMASGRPKPTCQLNVLITDEEWDRVARTAERTGWSKRKVVVTAVELLSSALDEIDAEGRS